jgi:hypothetical protein
MLGFFGPSTTLCVFTLEYEYDDITFFGKLGHSAEKPAAQPPLCCVMNTDYRSALVKH